MPEKSEHQKRIEDVDHTTHWLGTLEGIAVNDTEDGPVLFLHGDEQSCGIEVEDLEYTDGLARAGVEIEQLIEGSTE